jgi:hypothetical protein
MTKETSQTAPKKIALDDLDTVAASSKAAKMELRHPVTKAPLGQFIWVYGKDSEQVSEYTRELVNANIRKQAAMERRGETPDPGTVEEGEKRSINILVAATADFEGVNYDGQEPYPFSAQNARKLYSERKWVREQVDAFMGNLENFMSA